MSPEKKGPHHRPCCSLQASDAGTLTPDSPSLAGNGRLTLTSVRLFHAAANATHTAKRRSFAVVMNLANLPHLPRAHQPSWQIVGAVRLTSSWPPDLALLAMVGFNCFSPDWSLFSLFGSEDSAIYACWQTSNALLTSL